MMPPNPNDESPDDLIEVFDPSSLSHEDWLPYFFDRPIAPPGSGGDAWNGELTFAAAAIQDEAKLLSYLRRFNNEFAVIQKRFSLDQINQGLSALYGFCLSLGNLFASEASPLDLRFSVIESFEPLYRQAVKGWSGDIRSAESGGVFWMLWDLIVWQMLHDHEDHRPAGFDAILDKLRRDVGEDFGLKGLRLRPMRPPRIGSPEDATRAAPDS